MQLFSQFDMMTKILISGAGIAGLALARVLTLRSIPYKIIERHPIQTVLGAGIALPANAMNMLDLMELGNEVRESAYQVRSITYASPSEILSTVSLEEEPFNVNQFVALHRSKLHDILTRSIDQSVYYSTEICSIRETENGVIVTLDQNSEIVEEEFSSVIGADGINSAIRKSVFTDEPLNDFDFTVWRWTCRWNVKEELTEPFYMFDKGRVFMVYPISTDEVYCYAHKVNSALDMSLMVSASDLIKSIFSDCNHSIIQSMLGILTDNSSIIIGKMQSVENPVFSKRKISLIGDACHACTPMLQQGAALAFEDAIVLKNLIENFPINDALLYYSEFRTKKVTNMVKSSNEPLRIMSRDDVNMENIYNNIRENGPLNTQGWRKILSSRDLMEELGDFISVKKRSSQGIYFKFSSDGEENRNIYTENFYKLKEIESNKETLPTL